MKNRVELAKYFHRMGFNKGAEIGVARGAYSEVLCKRNPGLELFCVDPWELDSDNRGGGTRTSQYQSFNLAKRKLKNYNALFVRMFSLSAVKLFRDKSLDFVYIDANHDFDHVMMDIIEWSKKVIPGGIVAGHDYYEFGDDGVRIATDTYAKVHKITLNVTGSEGNISQDDKKPSFWWINP